MRAVQILRQYLVVDSSQPENAYGRFAGEILVSEGLMGFTLVDLATEPLPALQPNDLLVVTRCFLRRAQLEAVLAAIDQGACAVFFQPQRLLMEVLGFTSGCRVINPGCVRFRGEDYPLQTHLPVPCYELPEKGGDWEVLADALDADWVERGAPAVVEAPKGKGTLVLFFYDLAEAVARIRFGNPDLGGYAANGNWAWPHTLDLFVDHIDERVAHLPQADLHGQFLAKVLTDAAPYPLARLWYYAEAAHRTACVFQSDGDMSTREQFFALADAIEQRGGTGTFYLMKETRLTQADVESLRARGHTFAPHVYPGGRNEELYFALPDGLKEETDLFANRFGAVSPSLQCHCAPWPGYMSMVPAHVENGYRLLFAYLPSPVSLWAKYICGSGRPMKLFDRDGTLHDCWQQPLLTMDDTTLIALLSNHPDEARDRFAATLDAALADNHSAVAMLSHPVSFGTYSSPVMESCFDRLRDADVPIYNADEWLDFADRRAAVRVEQAKDEDGRLVLTVSNLRGRIPVMLPAGACGAVEVNGGAVDCCIERRLGEEWCFIQLDPDEHGTDTRIVVTYSEQCTGEGGNQ
jgi:hypothetical protein